MEDELDVCLHMEELLQKMYDRYRLLRDSRFLLLTSIETIREKDWCGSLASMTPVKPLEQQSILISVFEVSIICYKCNSFTLQFLIYERNERIESFYAIVHL